jgi:hypothetical protein
MSRYAIAIVVALALSAGTDARSLMSHTNHGSYGGLSGDASYWATISTSQTVWSTTIVTPKWYLADPNGFNGDKTQYVSSGFLTIVKDIPRGNALPVQYQVVATKVNEGYTQVSIELKNDGNVVGRMSGQTSLLPGTNIAGNAIVHFT